MRELLEGEYGVGIRVREEDEDCELPRVYVGGELAFEGVPGEEGYLIELLKLAVEERLGLRGSNSFLQGGVTLTHARGGAGRGASPSAGGHVAQEAEQHRRHHDPV